MSDLPSGWAEAPVKELLAETIGGVWGKAPGGDEIDVLVVRVADFRDDGTIERSSLPLRSISTGQLRSRELRSGDILLEKSGGGPNKPVGRAVRVPALSDRVVPTNFVQLLRPRPEVDADYLFWWLWWSHLRGSANEFQRATTNIRNLRTQDYLCEPCPLAPHNEQRRIAAAIAEQFSRLDAAERSLESARQRVGIARQAALVDILDGVWPSVRLGDIAAVDSGPAFRSAEFRGPGEGIRLLRGENIEPGRLRWRDTRTWPESQLPGYEHLLVDQSDVILAMDRPLISTGLKLARVKSSDLPALLVQRVARIRPTARISTGFLHLALQHPRLVPHLLRGQTGTQVPHITLASIRAFEMRLPSADEQLGLVYEADRQLSVLDATSRAITSASRRTVTLRRSILERAFQGELVDQDPSDEPAPSLLARLSKQRLPTPSPSRRRKVPR